MSSEGIPRVPGGQVHREHAHFKITEGESKAPRLQLLGDLSVAAAILGKNGKWNADAPNAFMLAVNWMKVGETEQGEKIYVNIASICKRTGLGRFEARDAIAEGGLKGLLGAAGKSLVSADRPSKYVYDAIVERPLQFYEDMKRLGVTDKQWVTLLHSKTGDPENKPVILKLLENKKFDLLKKIAAKDPALFNVLVSTPIKGPYGTKPFIHHVLDRDSPSNPIDTIHALNAIQPSNLDQWERLLLQTDENGENILHRVVRNGNVKMVAYLMENTPLFEQLMGRRNNEGKTPLTMAGEYPQSEVYAAADYPQSEVYAKLSERYPSLYTLRQFGIECVNPELDGSAGDEEKIKKYFALINAFCSEADIRRVFEKPANRRIFLHGCRKYPSFLAGLRHQPLLLGQLMKDVSSENFIKRLSKFHKASGIESPQFIPRLTLEQMLKSDPTLASNSNFLMLATHCEEPDPLFKEILGKIKGLPREQQQGKLSSLFSDTRFVEYLAKSAYPEVLTELIKGLSRKEQQEKLSSLFSDTSFVEYVTKSSHPEVLTELIKTYNDEKAPLGNFRKDILEQIKDAPTVCRLIHASPPNVRKAIFEACEIDLNDRRNPKAAMDPLIYSIMYMDSENFDLLKDTIIKDLSHGGHLISKLSLSCKLDLIAQIQPVDKMLAFLAEESTTEQMFELFVSGLNDENAALFIGEIFDRVKDHLTRENKELLTRLLVRKQSVSSEKNTVIHEFAKKGYVVVFEVLRELPDVFCRLVTTPNGAGRLPGQVAKRSDVGDVLSVILDKDSESTARKFMKDPVSTVGVVGPAELAERLRDASVIYDRKSFKEAISKLNTKTIGQLFDYFKVHHVPCKPDEYIQQILIEVLCEKHVADETNWALFSSRSSASGVFFKLDVKSVFDSLEKDAFVEFALTQPPRKLFRRLSDEDLYGIFNTNQKFRERLLQDPDYRVSFLRDRALRLMSLREPFPGYDSLAELDKKRKQLEARAATEGWDKALLEQERAKLENSWIDLDNPVYMEGLLASRTQWGTLLGDIKLSVEQTTVSRKLLFHNHYNPLGISVEAQRVRDNEKSLGKSWVGVRESNKSVVYLRLDTLMEQTGLSEKAIRAAVKGGGPALEKAILAQMKETDFDSTDRLYHAILRDPTHGIVKEINHDKDPASSAAWVNSLCMIAGRVLEDSGIQGLHTFIRHFNVDIQRKIYAGLLEDKLVKDNPKLRKDIISFLATKPSLVAGPPVLTILMKTLSVEELDAVFVSSPGIPDKGVLGVLPDPTRRMLYGKMLEEGIIDQNERKEAILAFLARTPDLYRDPVIFIGLVKRLPLEQLKKICNDSKGGVLTEYIVKATVKEISKESTDVQLANTLFVLSRCQDHRFVEAQFAKGTPLRELCNQKLWDLLSNKEYVDILAGTEVWDKYLVRPASDVVKYTYFESVSAEVRARYLGNLQEGEELGPLSQEQRKFLSHRLLDGNSMLISIVEGLKFDADCSDFLKYMVFDYDQEWFYNLLVKDYVFSAKERSDDQVKALLEALPRIWKSIPFTIPFGARSTDLERVLIGPEADPAFLRKVAAHPRLLEAIYAKEEVDKEMLSLKLMEHLSIADWKKLAVEGKGTIMPKIVEALIANPSKDRTESELANTLFILSRLPYKEVKKMFPDTFGAGRTPFRERCDAMMASIMSKKEYRKILGSTALWDKYVVGLASEEVKAEYFESASTEEKLDYLNHLETRDEKLAFFSRQLKDGTTIFMSIIEGLDDESYVAFTKEIFKEYYQDRFLNMLEEYTYKPRKMDKEKLKIVLPTLVRITDSDVKELGPAITALWVENVENMKALLQDPEFQKKIVKSKQLVEAIIGNETIPVDVRAALREALARGQQPETKSRTSSLVGDPPYSTAAAAAYEPLPETIAAPRPAQEPEVEYKSQASAAAYKPLPETIAALRREPEAGVEYKSEVSAAVAGAGRQKAAPPQPGTLQKELASAWGAFECVESISLKEKLRQALSSALHNRFQQEALGGKLATSWKAFEHIRDLSSVEKLEEILFAVLRDHSRQETLEEKLAASWNAFKHIGDVSSGEKLGKILSAVLPSYSSDDPMKVILSTVLHPDRILDVEVDQSGTFTVTFKEEIVGVPVPAKTIVGDFNVRVNVPKRMHMRWKQKDDAPGTFVIEYLEEKMRGIPPRMKTLFGEVGPSDRVVDRVEIQAYQKNEKEPIEYQIRSYGHAVPTKKPQEELIMEKNLQEYSEYMEIIFGKKKLVQ